MAEGDYIESWDLHGNNPESTDVTTNGTNIWVCELVTGVTVDEVYQYDMSGNYVTYWTSSARSAHGITTDNNYIWIADNNGREIDKHEMNGTFLGDTDMTFTGSYPVGICTDGVNIWVFCENANVYKFNMSMVYQNSSWASGRAAVSRITTDGNYFWIVESNGDNKVYKYEMDGTPVSNWDLDVNNEFPNGIGQDGEFFYITDMDDDIMYVYELEVIPDTTYPEINIGDSWKEVSAVKVNIGDTWKEVAGAQVNIGDTWKEIF